MTLQLKISLPNVDVKTASPEELAVDSNYDSLKLPLTNTNPNFGEVFVQFNTNPDVGTYRVFTFNWKYDYTPFYYVLLDLSKSSKTLSSNTSNETGTVFSNVILPGIQDFIVSPIPNGFKIEYVVTDNFISIQGEFFSFRYFVYANDGT